MSGKRTRALRREFKRVFGRAPETKLAWSLRGNTAIAIVGNQFRAFKRSKGKV